MKDFTLILAAVTVLCGIAWFWDFLKVRPLRNARILAAEKAAGGSLSKEEREKLEAGNWFVDLGRECFWVLLAVFLFRSFLFEPFRIPSESMMPTLLKGDFVAVEKYAYGIRNPFTGKVMIGAGSPSRGDIAAFRYPEDPDTAFIKRIIGLPGDTVSYDEAKNLTIKPADGSDPVTVPKEWTGIGEFSLAGHPLKRGTEDLLFFLVLHRHIRSDQICHMEDIRRPENLIFHIRAELRADLAVDGYLLGHRTVHRDLLVCLKLADIRLLKRTDRRGKALLHIHKTDELCALKSFYLDAGDIPRRAHRLAHTDDHPDVVQILLGGLIDPVVPLTDCKQQFTVSKRILHGLQRFLPAHIHLYDHLRKDDDPAKRQTGKCL